MSHLKPDLVSTIKGPPRVYNTVEEIPIEQSRRPCTDILCTIVGILFFLALMITAIVIFNQQIYIKTNFPTDSDGKLCGVDYAAYKYLYFANAPNIDRRVCVSKCPGPNDFKLECMMTKTVGCKFNTNPSFQVKKYEIQSFDGGRVGYFCLPKDQVLKQQLEDNAKIASRIKFINSLDTIVLSMIMSVGLSLLYLILVQCIPKIMNWAVLFITLLITLALAICMFTYFSHSHQVAGKVIVGLLLLLVFVICVVSFFKNRQAIRLNGVFLQWATRAMRENCAAFLYIPLFMIFLTCFILLIIYQFRSFWTGGGEVFFKPEQSIFWEFNSTWSVVLSVLMALEVIWGLSFLKQAFNFIISGVVVGWYFKTDWGCTKPFRYLICNHFGSVVAAAFMFGFFTVPDYLIDLITPRRHYGKVSGSVQNQGCYGRCFNSLFAPCLKVLNLVRSDSLAYINIAGNPYCNAARYCLYMSYNSVVLASSQETSNTYRILAHFTIAGIVGILSLYVKGTIVPLSLLVIIFLSVFIATFFISFHADAASAIGVSFVSNEQFIKRSGKFFTDNKVPEDQFVRKQIAYDINQALLQDPNSIC